MAEIEIKLGAESSLVLHPGVTHVFVGANGAGKTRLGHRIERELLRRNEPCQRLFAQRALEIREVIEQGTKSQLRRTLEGEFDPGPGPLVSGGSQLNDREYNKYNFKPVSSTLEDFNLVLALMFHEYTECAIRYTESARISAQNGQVIPTPDDATFDRVRRVFTYVHPGRDIVFESGALMGLDVQGERYPGAHLSDGERATIYLAAHVYLLEENGWLIIDEPESRLHKAALSKCVDALEGEAARKNLTMVYLTHDLAFASSRLGARHFWVRGFDGQGVYTGSESVWTAGEWQVEPLGDLVGGEHSELMLEVLGSGRPVLFVEGKPGTHEEALYKALFPANHVVSKSTCRDVMNAVAGLRDVFSRGLAVVGEPQGIIDRDSREDDECQRLGERGIYPLKVATYERLLVSQNVLRAALMALGHTGHELDQKLEQAMGYKVEWFEGLGADRTAHLMVGTRLKRRAEAFTVRKEEGAGTLAEQWSGLTEDMDVDLLLETSKRTFNDAIARRDDALLMRLPTPDKRVNQLVDTLAKRVMGLKDRKTYLDSVTRWLRSGAHPALRDALLEQLDERVRPQD